MNISNIKELDVANGDGIRTSIFVSGCQLHCKGCFNYKAWDFNTGDGLSSQKLIEIINTCKPDVVKGLSILGGEPLDENNQCGVFAIIKYFRDTFSNPESGFYNPNKDIWLWTGYIYKNLEPTNLYFGQYIPQTKYTEYILDNVDYLIDGPYMDELRNLNLKYRGSSNQRVLKNTENGFIQLDI